MKTLSLLSLIGLSGATPAHAATPSQTLLPTGPGPEDMELIPWGPAGGQALITATARRLPWQKQPQGALEIHEIGGAPTFTPLPGVYPHGAWKPLAVWRVQGATLPGSPGQVKDLLYVVNATVPKGMKGSQVEIFELQAATKTLTHLRTLGPSPLLTSPNSLVATRDGTVYISNFNLFGNRKLKVNTQITPEAAAPEKPERNTLVCYRPQEQTWRVVATGINGANGLCLTPDEKHLLCNAYHAKQVLDFTRDPATGRLTNGDIVFDKLAFFPDNLKLLPSGEYCAAGQTNFITTALHFLTVATYPTGGSAVSFTYTPGHAQAQRTRCWRETMRGDKRCTSTAIPHGGHLYLSHIIKPGVMRVVVSPSE
ncbi:SMP-30/gluconolactonase/LRE family protein [Prosthecobacter debontii]|nr:SMP-30/gluconolactonase/LRE family protein [Prosthecobacter debontii]